MPPAGPEIRPPCPGDRMVPENSATKPFPPASGFVQAVPDADPYPAFPTDTLGRLRWAEEAPIRNATAKHVLLVLAHRADTDGKAWPALDTLADWCGLTPRGARKALQWLQRRGWVESFMREGRSSLRWPKSPAETVCPGCWYRACPMPDICPSCGWTGDLVQRMEAEPRSGGAEPRSGGAEPRSAIRTKEVTREDSAIKGRTRW